jgi:8-amino-3,8-dideoxy-alpha-D-manno-octulosonate transaminase
MLTTDRLAIDGGTPVRSAPLPLGRGLALFGDEEKAAVLAVLESRSLFRYYGPDLQAKVDAFEQALTTFAGCRHAVATSSGTAAIRAALAAIGVGCGDEVVVPAVTFIATVNAVVAAGAVPVFAEVDDTLNLDPDALAGVLSPRTAAVIPVHLENVACDMDPILAVTRAAGVPVVEDAAQAMGATYHGRRLGTLGDLGAFSLQLEKNVTTGEGGAVVTDDPMLWLRAARYQDQGGQFVTGPGHTRGDEMAEPFLGENLRMTEIAGAIAEVQLRRLPAVLTAMRENSARIRAAVGDLPGCTSRRSPDPAGDGGSSLTWFLPTPALAQRFVDALLAEGVPSARMYGGLPVYANPAVLARRTASGKGGPWHCAEHPTAVEYRIGMCPQSEDLLGRSATVGVGAAFTARDCADVATAVRKVADRLLGD